MKFVDWNTVEEKEGGFHNPAPGAYIAVITSVMDKEDKEYLRVEWDFAEGEYKGYNRSTYDRAKFWPMTMFWSYKDACLGYFKQRKTAVEKSNPGFRFDCNSPSSLVGKYIGVVLGEEEYEKANGSVGKRLYVAQVRSIQSIQSGDFKVPDLKTISRDESEDGQATYKDLSGDDDELPF